MYGNFTFITTGISDRFLRLVLIGFLLFHFLFLNVVFFQRYLSYIIHSGYFSK